MKLKKIISILMLAVLVLSVFTGCKKEETSSGEGLSGKINELAWTVDRVVDMPDWTGKKMKLVQWFAQGTASPYIGKQPTDTTIPDEFKRITGISWDAEKSFDNSGMSPDAKIAKLVATNEWPDVGYNIEVSLIERLAQSGYIWDLTELIPKYMPNYMKVIEYNERSKAQYATKEIDGKHWYIPKVNDYGVSHATDPDYSDEKYSVIFTEENTRASIQVRDDILRMIYPEAHTREELEQIYVEKGEFTYEELTDVTIDSLEEFDEFLRKINDLNITQDGRKVFAFYTHNGTDNWDILRTLTSVLNGGIPTHANDYFAYFDREEGKLVRTIDQSWFKESMRTWAKLIADGVASQEALIDTKATFDQKKNNGEYAVLYGSASAPGKAVLKAGGKDYLYRPVFINIKPNYDKFIKRNTNEKFFGERFVVFKTGQLKTEEDVEQILRYFDFFYTPIACKLLYWGPEDSGIYTENEDGTLKYLDELLEQDRVYGGTNKRAQYYGLTTWPDICNWAAGAGAYNPKLHYGELEERLPGQYTKKFRGSEIEKAPSYPAMAKSHDIYNWCADVDGIQTFWDARQSSEDAFKKVFTAKNDEEFERLYKNLVDTVTKNGLDEKTMEDWNKAYKETNKDFWDDYINWKPDNK